MDRNYDWLKPALDKLCVLQSVPGRKGGRMYKKPLERIISFFRHSDESEWSSVYEYILMYIADHFREGKPLSAGFKKLADALAQLVFVNRNLEFIRNHYFLQTARPDISEARAESILSIAFFKLVGESRESSVNFCRMILDEHAEWEESYARAGRPDIESQAYDTMPWTYTVMYSASAPVSDLIPIKRWLENLITAARENDLEAERCVQGIFEMIWIVWDNVTVMSQTTYELMHGVPDVSYVRDNIPEDIREFQMKLILTDENAEWAAKRLLRSKKKDETLARKANDFVAWVESNNEALEKSLNSKIHEMLHQPRYGLIKGGYDSVMIQLSPLKVSTLTSFSFYPDNGSLDDMRIQFNRKTIGDRLCQLMLGFKDFSLVDPEILFPSALTKHTDVLTSILEYAVVDAMHSIVCREPRKNEAGKDVPREKSRPSDRKRREIVRPFLRRLPHGYEASDEARDRAFLELGWYLPEGVTFVQSHERFVGLPAKKPPPLFTYTDERFKQSILEE